MKSKFQITIIGYAVMIAFIPLSISYGIFMYDKLTSIEEDIETQLYNSAIYISHSPLIQETLNDEKNDLSIQNYVRKFVNELESVDIIVVADMTGEKYSHLDTTQIGQIFVNDDKVKVLEDGEGYYSLKKGSMGVTYRRFEPIFYNGEQVGFVMVGKYYEDIQLITKHTKVMYLTFLIIALIAAGVSSYYFSKIIKRKMLNMEPEEIAKLYKEKKAIINSINNGIIATNRNNEVVEVNGACYKLFDSFTVDAVLNKLQPYLNNQKDFILKELIILNRKLFVTLNTMYEGNTYLGAVITLIDTNKINQLAKDITGVDQLNKSLRANVHEFRNKLHVIVGLIQLKEYEQAKRYILETQEIQESSSNKYKMIDDNYVRAILISKDHFAKEKHVKLSITDDSVMYQDHGYIDFQDLITIIGNLIENAIESYNTINSKNKLAELRLVEDNFKIKIEVSDYGNPLPTINIFERGISTKPGENRGNGLYLVKNKVELYNGTIDLVEHDDKKTFMILLYKGENL